MMMIISTIMKEATNLIEVMEGEEKEVKATTID